jgi:hypothetical protein
MQTKQSKKGNTTMNTETATVKFTIGEEVAARSLGDWDCIFRFTVISRTAKFVTLNYYGEPKRVKIHVRDGREYCYPLGTYSMACSVHAGINI